MSLADRCQPLSKKIERDQTIQLSAEDLDHFVVCGACEKLSQAAADEAKA